MTSTAHDEIDLAGSPHRDEAESHVAGSAAATGGGAAGEASASGADGAGGDDAAAGGEMDEEAEIQAMKARVAEMEAEAAKLRELQAQAELEMNGGASSSSAAGAQDGDARAAAAAASLEEKEEVDSRSIYVKNVDWGATPEELQQHFQSCGTINRVTILCDKFTGHPKGYAYVEFADPSLVANAMMLHESLFRGRLIKVEAKRTNLPGMSARGRGRGRGRGRARPFYRGRGRGRGYY